MHMKSYGQGDSIGLTTPAPPNTQAAPQTPYFAENSEAMLCLEAMIDRVGINNVLYALSFICGAKAAHVAMNWQDTATAKVWAQRAAFFDDKASTILMSEG
jgi:hypothetical protein